MSDIIKCQNDCPDQEAGRYPNNRDGQESYYHITKGRQKFLRRLRIRRIGWHQNNAYLSMMAKQTKEAKTRLVTNDPVRRFRMSHPLHCPPYPKKIETGNDNPKE
eukprot:TRINITY_DN7444_c0_g1_i1.p2 TRINITY_DN7444_c0_g1~~TRINITY_DN7444_c0_g1_i1.p2  ORF type:complete len:105 (-),score=9.23 TRINITY_DN7444_c0_g1_i1:32-346(-)